MLKFSAILLSAVITLLSYTQAQAQFFEDFETGAKTSYAAGSVDLSTGSWFFDDSLLGRADGDRKNGAQSARVRASIYMLFDKPNGADVISFYAANSGFSGDSGGKVQLSYSTNGGSSWTNLGDEIELTNTLTRYEIDAAIDGNIRIRLTKTAGNRISIDDVRISDYVALSEEPTIVIQINDQPVSSGGNFSFGTVTSTANATFQIRNAGEATLSISSFEISNNSFTISPSPVSDISGGASRNFTLTFTNETPGPYQGQITINSNDPNRPVFTLQVEADVLDTSQPIPIAEARNLPAGTLVTVAGWVTVTDEFRGPVYFQDTTGGIAWYNDSLMRQNWGLDIQHGDSLVVTGQLGAFNQLIQIVNDVSYEIFPESNRTIEPQTITVSQLNSGNFESQFIRIADFSFTQSGVFSGGTNYTINDGTSGQLRVDNFTNIPGAPIPSEQAVAVGVAGRFNQTHQILPRSRSDIRDATAGPIILTAPPFEIGATSGSITFQWETELDGHSEICYGTTVSLELGCVSDQSPKTLHTLTIEGLQAASTYKVQLRSAVGTDTSATSIYLTSTSSPEGTTGEILTFFNRGVAHDLATYQEAAQNVNFAQQLITRMNNAEQSAVFAFYNISGDVGDDIASAILAAHNRGVDIRVIISNHTGNPNAIHDRLINSGVRSARSTSSEQMHNKFAIFDHNHSDPTKAWVVTSSWNATQDGTFNQYQNMVNIQDVALARAYVREFNQMWGAESGDFNASNARFSSAKQVVNPSVFFIGENNTKVELYFSPQANTEAQINRTLSSAQHTINLGLNLITRRSISNTMLARFNQGVAVRGVVGDVNVQGSDFEYLQNWADVHHFQTSAHGGLLHHKYAIVDGENGAWDSKVITGSHNWSANANTRNDENTLVIHNSRVANEFIQEFGARYRQAGGQETIVVVSTEEETFDVPSSYSLHQNYPNPFNPVTTITYELPASAQVSIFVYDVTGRRVATLVQNQHLSSGSHQVQFDGSQLASGLYLYRMQTSSGQSLTRKMMLIK